MTEQEYLQKIHELEKQVLRLQTEIKKNSETQYGLRWMDVPEAFEAEADNAIPTLEEVKEKAISNDDGKPTHILIEGDNFHALTCLNYTHKGQIDVIYIDPPYNTGSDGFVYKDKRVLDKFPDGTNVPTDHPLRHSYWLSFMHKRLELAKNLLSERGVIFISIDDNEQANLKLLCDQVFGEENFIGKWCWYKSATPPNLSYKIRKNIEYVLCYEKSKNNTKYHGVKKESKSDDPITKPQNTIKKLEFPPFSIHFKGEDGVIKAGVYGTEKFPNKLCNDMIIVNGVNTNSVSFENKFIWIQERLEEEIKNGTRINCSKAIVLSYKKADYDPVVPSNFIDINVGVDTTENAGREIANIIGEGMFDYPKPTSLIKYLLNFAPSSTILDFFAGSGTTMHATMQLNEEDGGHRQCILVQQNENNICEAVTYERNKRVMQGYTNSKKEYVPGLGNSMKYYRTAFVGEHKITDITDADKVALTQKAGCLLALGENTLEEIKTAKSYQIFQLRKGDKPTNDFGYTAVYFSGNLLHFADFRREIEQIQTANPLTRIAVYVFTWGDPSVFENEFDDLSGITIKPIPQPILEIYQNIHQL